MYCVTITYIFFTYVDLLITAPSSTRIADVSEGTYGFYFCILMLIGLVATVVAIAIYLQLRRNEIVGMYVHSYIAYSFIVYDRAENQSYLHVNS